MMKEFSIGYNELMGFPYSEYLEFAKILSLENKEEQKQREQQKKDMPKT